MYKQEIKFSGTIRGIRYENHKAILYKGKPLSDPPKSYILIGSIIHSLGNTYNSSSGRIFINKQQKLIYEIYRDGCFNPYYGNFKIAKY